jgi:EAL domain-containing protein (putative c-di-GMP-specific phosphodiesterase class I)
MGRRFAERLVALGCAFALDDFGTGYGSFTYLRQLPIAYLKIDLQFVREMTHSGADQRLVKTIVSIAQSLGKMTIAEGVEGEDTLHMLSDFGVDFAQGYHLGRPEPFAEGGAGPLSG